MRSIALIIPIAVTFLVCSVAQAKVIANICGPRNYLFFANGVNNSYKEADGNLKWLAIHFANRIKDEDDVHWHTYYRGVAYNYNQGIILELLEAYVQKKGENVRDFWIWLASLENAPEWFREIALRPFAGSKLRKQNLEEQVVQYKDALENGFHVLTVAHSQGNLFTNEAFDIVARDPKAKGRIATVAVATPASYVAMGGPHVTLVSDGVIETIRMASKKLGIEPPLPANTYNTYPFPKTFDHSFIEYYLEGKPAGAKILDAMVKQLNWPHSKESAPEKGFPSSQECLDWWASDKVKHPEDPDQCVIECMVRPIDLSNSHCQLFCDYFCNCAIEFSGF